MELYKWKELLKRMKIGQCHTDRFATFDWELKELMFRLRFNDKKNFEMSISDTGKLIKKEIHQE